MAEIARALPGGVYRAGEDDVNGGVVLPDARRELEHIATSYGRDVEQGCFERFPAPKIDDGLVGSNGLDDAIAAVAQILRER